MFRLCTTSSGEIDRRFTAMAVAVASAARRIPVRVGRRVPRERRLGRLRRAPAVRRASNHGSSNMRAFKTDVQEITVHRVWLPSRARLHTEIAGLRWQMQTSRPPGNCAFGIFLAPGCDYFQPRRERRSPVSSNRTWDHSPSPSRHGQRRPA